MDNVEYTTRVLPGGCLDIPANIRHDLRLEPHTPVKVTLSLSSQKEEDSRSSAARDEVWRKLQTLHDRLSEKSFSLTDALLEARQEEDDVL